jgi:PAS domain S-box-containing protein
MNERDARRTDGVSPEQLVAQLEELGREELQSVLGNLAAALFPAAGGTLPQLTWPNAEVDPAGAITDPPPIDEAAAADAKMRAAELRYRTLVEQIPAITFVAMLGDGKNEIYVSPHIEVVLGFRQQEWLENPFLWYTQLHPDDRALWIEEFARGCRAGGPFSAECRFIARDGRIVWLRGEARLIKDELGRPSFLQGVAYDITESKAAQAAVLQVAVRTTEQRYRELVERLGAIFWEVDAPSGNFTFVSRGTEEILGFPADRWLADPRFWIDQVHRDDRTNVAATWEKTLQEGGDYEIEFRAITSDGQTRWLHNRIHVPLAVAGNPRALGVILDFTERRRVEEELAGTLAREAHHAHEEKHRLKLQTERLRVVKVTMRTVQDIVNNSLNQLQLLRFEAEGHVSEETLELFDEAIQDTAEKLSVLGNLEAYTENQMSVGTGLDASGAGRLPE